jgi:hypothetical protein
VLSGRTQIKIVAAPPITNRLVTLFQLDKKDLVMVVYLQIVEQGDQDMKV